MSQFRLRKHQIIRRKGLFSRIFQTGVRINSEHMVLLAVRHEKKEFGFAVSQKIKGVAKKNRARRRLRELVRLNQELIRGDVALVVVGKPGIERVKFETLMREFVELLRKLESNDIP